ncbi:helix-turn-helix transcriptional regulator [Nocardia sp. NPDC020380]|uniref:helix-turn-helix transcriptional regulator n=1 Tax=Nocardia sp. NPDC020380 TaxID=3364309 RepID=UPI0037ADCEE2
MRHTGAAGHAVSRLPPLLLDDEETVAVAIGLRTTSGGPGIAQASQRALAKLEQVLPSRLRHRLDTLQRSMVRIEPVASQVDPDTLIAVTGSCDRHERLRFDYTNHTGGESQWDVEPHAVINLYQHWYLVAYVPTLDQWRSFRVDRLLPRIPTGPHFDPRTPPEGDYTTYLLHRMSVGAWPFQTTITLHASATELADQVWPGMGILEAVDDTHCLFHTGADTPASLAWMITSLGTDFTATGPPELLDELRTLAQRCQRALPT